MSNMELEMKILNVDEISLRKKIVQLGGKYISTSNQFLYVYDLMYINHRFLGALYELNNSENELIKNVNLNRIKNLFFEIDQILSDNDISYLQKNLDIDCVSNILNLSYSEILQILNSPIFKAFIERFEKTPHKWIRLRKTVSQNEANEIKESTTLTIKHILKNDQSGIQQMKETEIVVNSFEETNELLENLGFYYRCYQEKRRTKYILNDHEIDIDTWPGLPTYFEVEGKDREDLEGILNLLGYSFDEAVSCTTDDIYMNIGIDINNMKELKF